MTPWTVAIKLFYPWGFSGKSTGVGCHFLSQGIFPDQGLNPHLLRHVASLLLSHGEVPGAIMGDPTHDEVMKKMFRIQGTFQVGLSLYPTLYPPPFSAVVLVPLLRILVLPAKLSCSSFIE